MILRTLRNGLLRYAGNDGKHTSDSKYLSLRATKSRVSPFLILMILLTLCLSPCQAAIEFDGTNDYISTGIQDESKYDLTKFSISAWIKVDNSDPGFTKAILAKETGGTADGYALGQYNNQWIFWISGNSITSSTGWILGQWKHLVGTYDGTSMKLYLDGVQIGTTIAATMVNNDDEVTIGRWIREGAPERYWDGAIDDIRIYNKALSIEEIEQIYKSHKKRISGNLDFKATLLIEDLSGNNRHGNLKYNASPTIGYLGGNQTALNFDGKNDYIAINTDLTGANNTYSIWFKAGLQTSGAGSVLRPFIIQPETGGTGIADEISINRNGTVDHGKVRCRVGNGVVAQSTTAYNDNNWHHASCAWTASGTVFLYVDGIQVATGTAGTQSSMALTEIGGDISAGSGHRYLTGSLDEARIYNRELSPSEIAFLYNGSGVDPGKANLTAFWSLDNIKSGLITHFEMNDQEIGHLAAQAKDISGNLNHGQFIGFDNLVSNGFSTNEPAQIGTGYSLELDGVDDYIEINDAGNLYGFANRTFTVSARVKTSSITNDCVIAKDGGATGVGWSLFFGNFFTAATKGSGGVIAAARSSLSTGLNDNNWHHVVGIYTTDTTVLGNNNVSLYLDGSINQGVLTNSTQYVSPILPTTIGKRSSGNFFPGQIDDVRIYDRALTLSEISFLYNGSGLNPGTSNLQALWTFDDDTALKDSSGNNNHGAGVGGDSLKYTGGILRR